MLLAETMSCATPFPMPWRPTCLTWYAARLTRRLLGLGGMSLEGGFGDSSTLSMVVGADNAVIMSNDDADIARCATNPNAFEISSTLW